MPFSDSLSSGWDLFVLACGSLIVGSRYFVLLCGFQNLIVFILDCGKSVYSCFLYKSKRQVLYEILFPIFSIPLIIIVEICQALAHHPLFSYDCTDCNVSMWPVKSKNKHVWAVVIITSWSVAEEHSPLVKRDQDLIYCY